MKAKQVRAEVAQRKRKHKELWSAKNVRVLGDKLHAAIKENAPILGYEAPYCGIIPPICKEN